MTRRIAESKKPHRLTDLRRYYQLGFKLPRDKNSIIPMVAMTRAEAHNLDPTSDLDEEDNCIYDIVAGTIGPQAPIRIWCSPAGKRAIKALDAKLRLLDQVRCAFVEFPLLADYAQYESAARSFADAVKHLGDALCPLDKRFNGKHIFPAFYHLHSPGDLDRPTITLLDDAVRFLADRRRDFAVDLFAAHADALLTITPAEPARWSQSWYELWADLATLFDGIDPRWRERFKAVELARLDALRGFRGTAWLTQTMHPDTVMFPWWWDGPTDPDPLIEDWNNRPSLIPGDPRFRQPTFPVGHGEDWSNIQPTLEELEADLAKEARLDAYLEQRQRKQFDEDARDYRAWCLKLRKEQARKK
jgi:hypothetical protein